MSVNGGPQSSVVIFVHPHKEQRENLKIAIFSNGEKDYPWPFTAFLPFFLGNTAICLLPPVQVDMFSIKAIDLGELKKLRIRHDNSGSRPSWFLERVEIVDLKESTT